MIRQAISADRVNAEARERLGAVPAMQQRANPLVLRESLLGLASYGLSPLDANLRVDRRGGARGRDGWQPGARADGCR